MQFLIRYRASLTILMGIIAIAMLVSLIYAAKNGSKEKIIGSSIVLGFSLIAILCILIFRNIGGV